jgi:hypothetical protein
MIKIKFIEPFKHRNETTFRPLLTIPYHEYTEAGLKVVNDNSYDIAIVGQSSFTNKNEFLHDSIINGIDFVNKIDGDVILYDGQDSHSLIGTWGVFKNSKAEIMLKNTLLRDKMDYTVPSPNGRNYWKKESLSEEFYISEEDVNSEKFQKILLSGTTWLNTINYERNIHSIEKDIDIFAMFSHNTLPNFEYKKNIAPHYNQHRKNVLDKLSKLNGKFKILISNDTKISERQYYELLTRSKVVIAPFGYGEIAPRDLIGNMYGSVIFKPEMTYLNNPVYKLHNKQTYVPFLYSDSCMMLNEHIHIVLSEYNDYRENLCNSFCDEFEKTNADEQILTTLINNISQMKNYNV